MLSCRHCHPRLRHFLGDFCNALFGRLLFCLPFTHSRSVLSLAEFNCPRLQTPIAGPQSLQEFENWFNEQPVQQRSHRMIHNYLNLPTPAFLPDRAVSLRYCSNHLHHAFVTNISPTERCSSSFSVPFEHRPIQAKFLANCIGLSN